MFSFGCRMKNLMELSRACTAMNFQLSVAHADMRTHQFTIVTSYSLWWLPTSLKHPEVKCEDLFRLSLSVTTLNQLFFLYVGMFWHCR